MTHRIVFTMILSFTMSLLMSCWVTFVNLGTIPEFLDRWMYAFGVAWPAAAVIAFFFAPVAHKLTENILKIGAPKKLNA